MSIQKETNGQIVRTQSDSKAQKKPETGLVKFLEDMKPEIQRALPKHLSPDRMARIVTTALRTTKGLANCTPISFAGAVMAASVLGLEVNTPLGEAYLIPFPNRRANTVDCQLMIGYLGMLKLARQSGLVASVQAFPVMKGDEFRYELGLTPSLKHVPNEDVDRDDATKLTHVYAVCRLKDKDSEPVFVVLTKKQVEKSRMRGASGKNVSTPWDTDYVSMALKTAVRALFRWMPRSSEMSNAAAVDENQERGGSVVQLFPDETTKALTAGGFDINEAEFSETDVVEVQESNPDDDGR